MSDLIAITYKEEDSALGALNELTQLQKEHVIELEDAAVATMNQKGKVKVKQTLERQYTGTMATWGFFWGFLIGLIFGGPIFWGLATALLSGLLGKTADLGIDNKFIKEVGDSLEPGQSALFILVAKVTPDKVLPHLEKFGGEVRQTSLSKEDEEKLRKALEHPEVSKAAGEAIAPDEDPSGS
jgi:uncharacterized membrane protein